MLEEAEVGSELVAKGFLSVGVGEEGEGLGRRHGEGVVIEFAVVLDA